jgi:hypothetical protein
MPWETGKRQYLAVAALLSEPAAPHVCRFDSSIPGTHCAGKGTYEFQIRRITNRLHVGSSSRRSPVLHSDKQRDPERAHVGRSKPYGIAYLLAVGFSLSASNDRAF